MIKRKLARRRRKSLASPRFFWAVLHAKQGLEITDYVPNLYRSRRAAQEMASGWGDARPVRAVVMILPDLTHTCDDSSECRACDLDAMLTA